MEVGNISIVGKLDVSSITDSLSQLNNSLGKTKDIAKSSFGDIANLSKGLGNIAMGLGGIGVAAGGALVGLAAMGPYTAGAMARINVTMGELGRTISAALAPSFEKFADILANFGIWLSSPSGTAALELFSGILDGLITIIADVGSAASATFDWLSKLGTGFTATFDIDIGETAQGLIDNLGWAAVGAILGFKVAGPAGAVVGAGTGMVAQGVWNYQQDKDTIMQDNIIGASILNLVEGVNGFVSGDWLGSLAQMGGNFISGATGGLVDAGGFAERYQAVASGEQPIGANNWSGAYKDETALTQELNDKSGYTNRYIGDVD